MNKEINDGEENITTKESQREIQLPVSLRDYFAAKAMAAILESWPSEIEMDVGDIARGSYKVADAMLMKRKSYE